MKRLFAVALIALAGLSVYARPGQTEIVANTSFKASSTIQKNRPAGYPVAVFAGGCFWCVESDFRRIEGVLYTASGYSGGTEKNPTYKQVSAGNTGHREAVEIVFDPKQVSYRDLVDFFMVRAHDPTQADGQGPDIGPQYTSAIFYLDEDQKKTAQGLIETYTAEKKFRKPIATQVLPFTAFYPAEDYHQQYYEKSQEKTGELPMNLWIKQQKENALKFLK